MPTREILQSYTVTDLRKEISKTNIKGYSSMKKSEVIELMMKPEHKSKFNHLKMKGKPAKPEPAKPKSPGQKEAERIKAKLKAKEAAAKSKSPAKPSLPKKYEYVNKLPPHIYIVLHRHTDDLTGAKTSLRVTETPSQHRPKKSASGKEIDSKMLKEHIIELNKEISLKNDKLVVEYSSKDGKYKTKLPLGKAKALASGSIIDAPIDAFNDKFIRNVQVEDSKEKMLKTINKYNP